MPSPSVDEGFFGTPIVGDGVRYALTGIENAGGSVTALDTTTGTLRWRHVLPFTPGPMAALVGGPFFVSSGSMEIALNTLTGSLKWAQDLHAGVVSALS